MMKVSNQPGDGTSPVPLFVFCAMLPWQFFSTALTESGTSLVTNSNLISKVYFPRLVVPASSVITSFVDFAIAGGFTVFLMIYYRFLPPLSHLVYPFYGPVKITCLGYRFLPPLAHLVYLPVFVLLTFGMSFGAGLWIAALMVKYRDFRFVVPFVAQFGLYAAPVFVMTRNIADKYSEKWELIYSLNPVVGVIDGFRWCILGGGNVIYWPGQIASVAGVVFLVASGLWYFRKTERSFADVI
jgi:lipopolysaccharide transport system permease protein